MYKLLYRNPLKKKLGGLRRREIRNAKQRFATPKSVTSNRNGRLLARESRCIVHSFYIQLASLKSGPEAGSKFALSDVWTLYLEQHIRSDINRKHVILSSMTENQNKHCSVIECRTYQ
jgi:hypothetical protein